MSSPSEEATKSYASRSEGLTSEKVRLDFSRSIISNGVVPLMIGAGEALVIQSIIATGIEPNTLLLALTGLSLANLGLFIGTEYMTGGMEERVSTSRAVIRTGISLVVPFAVGCIQIAHPESRPFFNAAYESTMHNGGKALEWMGRGAKQSWDNFSEWWNRPSEISVQNDTTSVDVSPQVNLDSPVVIGSGTGLSGEIPTISPEPEWWMKTPIGTAYVVGTMLGIPALGGILAYKAHGFIKNIRGE